MPGLWNDLTDKLSGLAGKWASFTAIGTFLLYLLGYLALRFQLSAYGVATNLDVWDERYLFAGSRFVVNLVSAVPNVLLVVYVVVGIGWIPYRLLPAGWREKVKERWALWVARPNVVPICGTVVALAMIQFVMRKCFVLSNLLLRPELPRYEWIDSILLTDGANRSLYFTGLVGGTLLTGAMFLFAVRSGAVLTSFSRVLVGLLMFLFAVELLLLPVNYGVLVASQELPRVSEIPGDGKPAGGAQAWLVWESKEARVYFVRDADGKRTMITLPRKDQETRIIAYDAIFRVLFAPPGGNP